MYLLFLATVAHMRVWATQCANGYWACCVLFKA